MSANARCSIRLNRSVWAYALVAVASPAGVEAYLGELASDIDALGRAEPLRAPANLDLPSGPSIVADAPLHARTRPPLRCGPNGSRSLPSRLVLGRRSGEGRLRARTLPSASHSAHDCGARRAEKMVGDEAIGASLRLPNPVGSNRDGGYPPRPENTTNPIITQQISSTNPSHPHSCGYPRIHAHTVFATN
jgi:hypothetical protein